MDDRPTIIKVRDAMEIKPKFGAPCNHCGYCCLEEVCPVGQDLTGQTIGPCELLLQQDPQTNSYDSKKFYCSLAVNAPEFYKEIIGAGKGCCAKTQHESLEEMRHE